VLRLFDGGDLVLIRRLYDSQTRSSTSTLKDIPDRQSQNLWGCLVLVEKAASILMLCKHPEHLDILNTYARHLEELTSYLYFDRCYELSQSLKSFVVQP
jgi:hypothetical protein